jgi:hypothetical protein
MLKTGADLWINFQDKFANPISIGEEAILRKSLTLCYLRFLLFKIHLCLLLVGRSLRSSVGAT